jgi:hypothetical protein
MNEMMCEKSAVRHFFHLGGRNTEMSDNLVAALINKIESDLLVSE